MITALTIQLFFWSGSKSFTWSINKSTRFQSCAFCSLSRSILIGRIAAYSGTKVNTPVVKASDSMNFGTFSLSIQQRMGHSSWWLIPFSPKISILILVTSLFGNHKTPWLNICIQRNRILILNTLCVVSN